MERLWPSYSCGVAVSVQLLGWNVASFRLRSWFSLQEDCTAWSHQPTQFQTSNYVCYHSNFRHADHHESIHGLSSTCNSATSFSSSLQSPVMVHRLPGLPILKINIYTRMRILFIEQAPQLFNFRIGLVARICRSHSSTEDQNRQGRGSIPRFGI
jgi:hypothetical protein